MAIRNLHIEKRIPTPVSAPARNDSNLEIPHQFRCNLFQHLPQAAHGKSHDIIIVTGHPLTAVDPAGTQITGVFRRIDADGAMILECEDGEKRFLCGDIKIDVSGTDWGKMRREIKSDLEGFPDAKE